MSLPGNISNLARLPSASAQGYGDVDGPASSTDNAIALFNGTGGKTIKNSAYIMAGSGGTITVTGNATLNQDVSSAGSPTFAAGTFTGDLSVGTTDAGAAAVAIGNDASATQALIILNTPAGANRDVSYRTGNSVRWIVRANNTAESGANAGSNYQILARDDSAAAIGTALEITRSSMAATFGASLGSMGNLWCGNNAFVMTSGTTDGFYSTITGTIRASRDNIVGEFRRRSSDGEMFRFYRDTTQVGNISVTTTNTAYNTSSALAKKCNFREITSLQSGAFFDRAMPWVHDWKTGEKDSIGWGAEEIHANMLAAGLPAWGVTLAPDGGSVVDYSKVPDPITAAELKSLRARVKELEERLAK